MITASIKVDTKLLQELRETIADAPKNLRPVFEQNSRRVREQIETEMRKPAGPPDYPIRWKSERQRKAFFASNGFGRGIPTRRTGTYIQGWKVIFRGLNVSDGVVIELVNPVSYSDYVGGGNAQPFHIDRWPQAVDVVVKYEEELFSTLVVSWFAVVEG